MEIGTAAIVRLHGPGRSCTAFHIGDNIFLTAAHCINGQPLVFLDAEDGTEYLGVPILVDTKLDLAAVKSSTTFKGGTLQMWDPDEGIPKRGAELLALGYPGYYDLQLTIETGILKDFVVKDGEQFIISSDLAYFGESGGPVLAVKTGHLIGINDAMVEQITDLGVDGHIHNTISLMIAAPELILFLTRAQNAELEAEEAK